MTGTEVLNNKSGFLFYGVNGSASLPFYGGTKCVNQPIKRTPGAELPRDTRARKGLQRKSTPST